MTRISRHAQAGGSTTLTIILVLFIALVAAGTWAVYNFGGDGHIIVDGRTLDDLQPWEVVAGVVIGILGAIIGILAGLVGVIIGLVAAFLSVALALVGVAASLFVVAGVLAGPVLLLALVIFLFTRGSKRQAATADDSAPMLESSAEPAEA